MHQPLNTQLSQLPAHARQRVSQRFSSRNTLSQKRHSQLGLWDKRSPSWLRRFRDSVCLDEKH